MAGDGGHTRGKRWAPADDTQLRDLHGQGKSLGECATIMGCSKGTIHKYSGPDFLDLSWDRAQTASAAQSRSARAAEIRADMELRYAEAAVTYYDAMEQPCVATFAGVEYTLSKPLPSDRRAFAQMSMSFLKASQEIANRASDGGLVGARSMLGRLVEDIGGELAADARARRAASVDDDD